MCIRDRSDTDQPNWAKTVDFAESFSEELLALKKLAGNAPKGAPTKIGNKFCAVSELFDVQYGTNLELLRLQKCAAGVNFVSRTAKNNGVTAKVAPLGDLLPAAGYALSVAAGGSVLETFVQFEPFYSGRDMYVLRPKEKMTPEELMFYAFCVRANQWRYSYGRQANRTLKNLQIPARTSIPSWVYGALGRVADVLIERLAPE